MTGECQLVDRRIFGSLKVRTGIWFDLPVMKAEKCLMMLGSIAIMLAARRWATMMRSSMSGDVDMSEFLRQA
jgi:hypothetical protein